MYVRMYLLFVMYDCMYSVQMVGCMLQESTVRSGVSLFEVVSTVVVRRRAKRMQLSVFHDVQ